MKNHNLVKVLGILCLFLGFWPGLAKSQAATVTYQFMEAPFPAMVAEVLAADGLETSDIQGAIVLSRLSVSDLHFIFTEDHFYVVFNMLGMHETYKIPYQESIAGYETQCALNNIEADRLSCEEMVSAVLKHYSK